LSSYRSRQRKLAVSKNEVNTSTDKDDEDKPYSSVPSRYRKSMDFNYEYNEYSNELPADDYDYIDESVL